MTKENFVNGENVEATATNVCDVNFLSCPANIGGEMIKAAIDVPHTHVKGTNFSVVFDGSNILCIGDNFDLKEMVFENTNFEDLFSKWQTIVNLFFNLGIG